MNDLSEKNRCRFEKKLLFLIQNSIVNKKKNKIQLIALLELNG